MNQQLIFNLKKVITAAGDIALALRAKGLVVNHKEDGSPVSNADLELSNFIYKNISKLTPDIPIICEEREVRKPILAESFWLVDPIDGTRSYIKNLVNFTVNIALIENHKPKLGFIYHPVSKKLYYTDHKNNLVIECAGSLISNIAKNKEGYIAVVSSTNFNENTKKYIENNNFSEIIAASSSIKLCMVASGAADIYPKFGPTMEWDIAAGHALINAAGGEIIDYNSKKELLYNKSQFTNPYFIAFNQRWKRLQQAGTTTSGDVHLTV